MAEPATTSPSDLYCAKDRDPSSAGSGIRYSEFEGKRLVEVGEALSDHLLRFVDTVSGHGRPQAKGEFPLPTRGFDKLPEFNKPDELGLVRLCCISLNSYFGMSGEYSVSEVHRKALGALAEIVSMLRVHQWDQKFPQTSWARFMGAKTIDYCGEEVRTAKAFSWKNLAPAIPTEAGTIPLESLCTGGVAHYVLNFEPTCGPPRRWSTPGLPRSWSLQRLGETFVRVFYKLGFVPLWLRAMFSLLRGSRS